MVQNLNTMMLKYYVYNDVVIEAKVFNATEVSGSHSTTFIMEKCHK